MKPLRVSPEDVRKSHHVKLSDGNKTIGLILSDSQGNASGNSITKAPITRTALKTSTGANSYTDFEPPWSPIVQNDWSGGRGKADYDDDHTRYADAMQINTMVANRAFLGPKLEIGKIDDAYYNWPKSQFVWQDFRGAVVYRIAKITAATAKGLAMKSCYLWLRRRGTPANSLRVRLISDDGTERATATITTTNIPDTIGVWYDTGLTYTMTNAEVYWIEVMSAGGTVDDCWQLGAEWVDGTDEWSTDGTTWYTDALSSMFYHLHTGEGTRTAIKRRFLNYKHQLYELYFDGTDTTLRMNGDRGAADSNSGALTTLVDATKTWTNDEWIGSVVHITSGPGSGEEIPWRLVTDNDGTSLTVSPAWVTTHTTDTEYVITKSNKWTTVETFTNKEYSDVEHMTYDIMAIAFGPDNGIVYYKAYNNSGTWEDDTHVDATNQAIKFQILVDSEGTRQLWKANIGDPGDPWNLSFTDTADYVWDTDPTWASEYDLDDDYGNVNGIVSYGDTTQAIWTFRDGMVQYQVSATSGETTTYWNVDLPLPEIKTWYDNNNGRAVLQHGVYLYFSYGQGVERYYNKQLDDVGPNREEGLPDNRQGNIMALDGYPGKYFAVIDADSTGYSSIMMSGGSDWHEIYRAPYGVKIYDIKYQTIQGIENLDRLWIAMGAHYFYLPMPSASTNPTKDSNMLYTHEGVLQLGYMYADLYDVYKLYYRLKLFTENLAVGAYRTGQTIEVDYRLDDDTAWVPLEEYFDESPIEEHDLASMPVTGRRIQLRLRFQTSDLTITPILKAAVLETIARVPIKYAYTMPFRVSDQEVDLNGKREEYTAEEKMEILSTWAESLTPLTMYADRKAFHDKIGFIDPQTIKPFMENDEGYIGQLVFTEL